jgi:hypothetical protein
MNKLSRIAEKGWLFNLKIRREAENSSLQKKSKYHKTLHRASHNIQNRGEGCGLDNFG